MKLSQEQLANTKTDGIEQEPYTLSFEEEVDIIVEAALAPLTDDQCFLDIIKAQQALIDKRETTEIKVPIRKGNNGVHKTPMYDCDGVARFQVEVEDIPTPPKVIALHELIFKNDINGVAAALKDMPYKEIIQQDIFGDNALKLALRWKRKEILKLIKDRINDTMEGRVFA